jgi:hypothetical protein
MDGDGGGGMTPLPLCDVVILYLPLPLTRVNSTNVQDEGLKIGGIGHRMNSKVKISQTRRVLRINMVINLAYS